MTRLYATVPPDKYAAINDSFMLHFLTEAEKQVLSKRYQHFKVNVPVIVSLMRDQGQAVVPFSPRTDRPVYCSSCFDKVRAAAVSPSAATA